MITTLARRALTASVLALLSHNAFAQETFKIGIVSFLSGQAAESFGIPAVNGAKVLVDAFNKGQAPAPYNKPGIGGMPIEVIYVDEAGGATKQVQELRNLYERDKVDVVVGYVGSGDCLAVAPVAEELKKFLILYDCGTPRIFEDNTFRYVFRTAAHATMDNVSMARYLKARNIPVKTFNLINQDYAWGQDSRKDFILSMTNLYPDAKAGVDQLPKFGAGQYGTEISALMSQPADLVHSSLWGGDLQAFVLHAWLGRKNARRYDFGCPWCVWLDGAALTPEHLVLGPLQQSQQCLPCASPLPHGASPDGFEVGC